MPDVRSIDDTKFQDYITQSVKTVGTTMLQQPVMFIGKATEAIHVGMQGRMHVLGIIGFKGEANGIGHFCLPIGLAQYAAAQILGLAAYQTGMNGDEVMSDVVGELTNMTIGGFKNALCELGLPCQLTLPKVICGDALKVATLPGANRYVYQFACNGHRLVIDLQLKRG